MDMENVYVPERYFEQPDYKSPLAGLTTNVLSELVAIFDGVPNENMHYPTVNTLQKRWFAVWQKPQWNITELGHMVAQCEIKTRRLSLISGRHVYIYKSQLEALTPAPLRVIRAFNTNYDMLGLDKTQTQALLTRGLIYRIPSKYELTDLGKQVQRTELWAIAKWKLAQRFDRVSNG